MAGRIDTFNEFLASGSINVSIPKLIFGLILAALLSYILGRIYIKYGTSLSNRTKFANSFMILSTTTTLVITVVKSSLALSLGLVGALSIVRFRAAIKEPEELLYLFLIIGIGLGLGANQFLITIISFVIIAALIFINSFISKKSDSQNINLLISGKPSKEVTLENITQILKDCCSRVSLKRFDVTDNQLETSFFVNFESFPKLSKLKNELEKLSKSIKVTYLERG